MNLARRMDSRVRWTVIALIASVASPSPVRASSSETPVTQMRRYPIRGLVVGLPKKGEGYLSLRHEPIGDFTDMDGEVVGMDSMVMPFPVSRDASLDGLTVGDKIEAVLVVDWEQGRQWLERVVKLPCATVLHFGKARTARDSPRSSGRKQGS